MLGESALLADLGPLLRLKQEMEVQEAVEKRSVSSNASASGSDAQQTTASLANRIASQESLISGFTATPRDTQVTARRPAPFRRLRLHACLVLEGLCQAIPSRSPGFFEVPVEDIFEMLQSSCSRAGACSFNLDEQPEPVPSQASKVLELHLSAARVAKLQHFAARLWLCNSSQRCVCGGDSGRIDDACSPCTCVDDATASCLWQLLAEHARQVDTKVAKCVTTPSCPSKEEVQEVCFDHAPSGGHQDGAEDPEDLLGKKWQWHRRLGLDSFLKLVAASLRQAISQLKGAQRAGTAGPDVIMSLQHRLSATLRLASRYLRPPAALPYGVPLTPQRLLLAQQVLSAPLTALKA
ncbi:Zinc finger protein 470 [Durusdinium trenchii]